MKGLRTSECESAAHTTLRSVGTPCLVLDGADQGSRHGQQAVDQGDGLVCDLDGRPYADLIVSDVSQEHGIMAVRPGSKALLPPLLLGARVRILPNHACATGAQHTGYRVVRAGSDAVIAEWARFSGW